jgi:hypothetical protein
MQNPDPLEAQNQSTYLSSELPSRMNDVRCHRHFTAAWRGRSLFDESQTIILPALTGTTLILA